jgi:hypothetical protein
MGLYEARNDGHSRDEFRDRGLHERWPPGVQSQPSNQRVDGFMPFALAC